MPIILKFLVGLHNPQVLEFLLWSCQGRDFVWQLQLYELCHHYNELSGAAKLDVHVMATVMAHCLSCQTVNNIEQTVGDLAAKVRVVAFYKYWMKF